ncbi:single-stranded DNA-binding protein (plasmid) [Burkholderia savannae]|uniref:Single-stranded DNA-binding protein n=1 Tax=Burkholderia savannae TaxID=1637837 RepID=A0ABR5T8E1_9BURK|nr:single-stranded DNA-binding protein [Burkholderia savannae]AOJ79222.1 single-stranded DNA-binding protein [Burkholderia savannae]KWZ39553.1 single-stranded DNA-binding protein [Burkholderia savannae]
MSSINQFFFTGNVTKDVVLRYLPGGRAVATYVVAVDTVYVHDGERREETDYIPVTTYGKQAENDAKYLKKGAGVAVTGRVRSWYKREERRGGFNFEVSQVHYTGRASSRQDSEREVESAPADDGWVADYDRGAHEVDARRPNHQLAH